MIRDRFVIHESCVVVRAFARRTWAAAASRIPEAAIELRRE
jgi:hypothetical protein